MLQAFHGIQDLLQQAKEANGLLEKSAHCLSRSATMSSMPHVPVKVVRRFPADGVNVTTDRGLSKGPMTCHFISSVTGALPRWRSFCFHAATDASYIMMTSHLDRHSTLSTRPLDAINLPLRLCEAFIGVGDRVPGSDICQSCHQSVAPAYIYIILLSAGNGDIC